VRARILVASLSLSAAALVGIVSSEGYTDRAVVPTQGDRPTVGFGSTFDAGGKPVRMGDTTTPVRALVTAQAHIAREESAFRAALAGVSLSQAEYDVYMDWTYQYGAGAWAKSSMVRELRAGQYRAACDALLRYRFAAGFDCSTPGNRRCAGVWARQQARHAACVAAQ